RRQVCWGMDTSPLLYAPDLTDAEWTLLEALLPPESPIGRPRLHSLRTILNALFYQLRTGGAWRFLPQEWPPWQTVYSSLRRWRRDGGDETGRGKGSIGSCGNGCVNG